MDGMEVNINPNNKNNPNTSSSFNYSLPDFVRDVLASFKRCPKMPISGRKPRRLVVRRPETASITPPSIMNTPTEDGNFMGVDDQRGEGSLRCDCRSNNMFAQPCLKCRQVVDPPKKVQFALGNDTRSHGSDDHMDTRTTNILTHMGSLALTEMERDVNNRVDVSAAPSHDANEQNVYNMDVDIFLKSFFGYTTPVNSVKSEKPASKKDPSAPRKRSYDPDL